MKKIYMILAAIALLSMSLNAQMTAKKKVVNQQATSTEKVNTLPDLSIHKASKPAAIKRAPSRATETATLSLFDTTSYVAQVLPIYGYWYDAAQHNQMIYPASLLTDMADKKITSMTFFPASYNNYSGINFRNGSITFKLMEVNNSSGFASSSPSYITGTMTTVKTLSMPSTANTSATTWLIEFDQAYDYNGGDLVIDVTSTAGNYGYTYFYIGTTSSLGVAYPGLLQYSTNSAQSIGYVPAVDFTYEYEDVPKHDLGIALDAQPATVAAGSDVTLTATVTNNGDYAESGYTVTFYANGTAIDTQNGGSLAIGGTQTFTTTYTTTDAQGGTTVNFTAVVTCTGDAVATNDEAAASTSVITLPPPINVAATPDGSDATVTWDAPVIPSVQQNLAWDFESQSQFNDWTLVSTDNDSYNWTYRTYDASSSASVFEPHSGTGYIVSPSFVNNVGALYPDNWLISPEVTLGGTFTFWAKGTDATYYAENFGVFVYEGSYSSGVSGFVQVDVDKTATAGWVKYTFDLSQYSGQGRIAIRHYNCTDQYWLEVDDIEYQVTVSGEQPTSYNVYLDGTLVGNVVANDPLTYDFSNLTDGQHTTEISAVYTLGESALVPATFTISSTNPELAISPADQTIDDNAAGTLTVTGTDITGNISVSAADNTNWSLNPTSLSSTGGNVNVTYTGRDLSASTTVTASATGATDATATVNYVADLYIVGNFGSGWDFNNGTHMSYNNGIYTATLTANANSYILFARLLGNDNPWNTRDVFGPVSSGDWWMQGNSGGGNLNLYASNCIYFPEGGTYTITINANDGTFTITKPSEGQTATPTITYTVSDEYVTITATGDGTVTLNVPGYDPAIGEGSASITIPRGYASNTITVTATAKEDGKDESVPASEQITIPAGSGWTEMDGTYSANDLLSFTKDGEDIMLVDQFMASTLNNDHPDHYTYTLRQTVNGETQTSSPVDIPVYKTNSSIQGLYTQGQVDTLDLKMGLRANVVNSEMDYDVNPDHNVLYYSLYRGEVDADYPAIDVQSRISQLQKFEDNVDGNIQYYMFENHQTGVAPRYDHLGNEIAERLDTNWVECDFGHGISYVPVIWTFGLYSGREDGKNNSYGSDIKRETLGAVHATYGGQLSDGPYGTYTYNGTMYRICHPVINITGIAPVTRISKDGDVSTYVPYMYRAWCTTPGMRDFNLVSGQGFEDAGEITAPFLLGTEVTGNTECHIGGVWDSDKKPWAFAIPDGTTPHFVVRFYYKKIVTEGQSNGTMLTLGNGEGEEYFIAQGEGDGNDIETGVAEMIGGAEPIDVTYVNSLGMQSNKPFSGVNIVVTRYSDGSTSIVKVRY